jgi:KipI family sensor histidine kinase inhibitor
MAAERKTASASGGWRPVGDRGLLREIEGEDALAANALARSLYESIRARSLAEVEDLIPGARSLLLLLRPGMTPSAELENILADPSATKPVSETITFHEILVAYGGSDGPDLEELARIHDLEPQALVTAHSSTIYTVGFLGFAPGFAYLLGLPDALATPRLATPRIRAPAGSVAIGGEFTAVYPRESPGGWRIIGRTEAILFDHRRGPPARMLPGDRVRFVPR